MKKSALALSLGSMLFTGVAQADTILGLYLGADGWNSAATGGFANSRELQNFNFEDKTQTSYFVALEHPIPVIPNIRVQRNQLESNGNALLTSDFTFEGLTFLANTSLNNQVDLSSTDYVLYYEILDNSLISLDLGVSAKHLKGELTVVNQATGVGVTHKASEYIPMVYSAAQVGLPLTGLDVFAQGSYVSIDGNSLYDVQAGIGYALLDNLAIDMRVKVGYRAMNLKLDDIDNLYTNLDFKGVFAGVEIHF